MAVTDPDIFFAALDTAGTFGISLLCGVLPAAMAWQQRYGGGANGKIATLPLVPGGKASLAGDIEVYPLSVPYMYRWWGSKCSSREVDKGGELSADHPTMPHLR